MVRELRRIVERGGDPRQLAQQLYRELVGPFERELEAAGVPLARAGFGDTVLAAQAFKYDADLVFGREVSPRRALSSHLCRRLSLRRRQHASVSARLPSPTKRTLLGFQHAGTVRGSDR